MRDMVEPDGVPFEITYERKVDPKSEEGIAAVNAHLRAQNQERTRLNQERTRLKLPATKGDVERLEGKIDRILVALDIMVLDWVHTRRKSLNPQTSGAKADPPADERGRVRLPRGK